MDLLHRRWNCQYQLIQIETWLSGGLRAISQWRESKQMLHRAGRRFGNRRDADDLGQASAIHLCHAVALDDQEGHLPGCHLRAGSFELLMVLQLESQPKLDARCGIRRHPAATLLAELEPKLAVVGH